MTQPNTVHCESLFNMFVDVGRHNERRSLTATTAYYFILQLYPGIVMVMHLYISMMPQESFWSMGGDTYRGFAQVGCHLPLYHRALIYKQIPYIYPHLHWCMGHNWWPYIVCIDVKPFSTFELWVQYSKALPWRPRGISEQVPSIAYVYPPCICAPEASCW